jgi:AbrB family looped-hinge helix DNA binding protein
MTTTATAKVGPKFQVVIPKKLREAARLKVGDFLSAELKREGILLKPATLVARDFKAELEQHLKEAEADVKAGRVYGPYNAKDALKGLDEAIKQERGRARMSGGGEAGKPRTNSSARRSAAKAGAHARTLHR